MQFRICFKSNEFARIRLNKQPSSTHDCQVNDPVFYRGTLGKENKMNIFDLCSNPLPDHPKNTIL